MFEKVLLTYIFTASLQMIQRMSLLKRLKVHNGCVNSICWNGSGELILSGSDDQHLVLTNAHKYEVYINIIFYYGCIPKLTASTGNL